jgi:hypothetical protein
MDVQTKQVTLEKHPADGDDGWDYQVNVIYSWKYYFL